MDIYERKFLYIQDETLRKHMSDTFRFIFELITIQENFSEENLNYHRKTCILYTAALIESHLHHYFLAIGLDEVINSDTRNYSHIKILHDFQMKEDELKQEESQEQDGKIIMLCRRNRPIIKIKDGTPDFQLLNKLAKKNGLYSYGDSEKNKDPHSIYEKIDSVRNLRNQIHLMKLGDEDRVYTSDMLEEVFNTAKLLFSKIKDDLDLMNTNIGE